MMEWKSQDRGGKPFWLGGSRKCLVGVTCELIPYPLDLHSLATCSHPALETRPVRSDLATSMESTPDFEDLVQRNDCKPSN